MNSRCKKLFRTNKVFPIKVIFLTKNGVIYEEKFKSNNTFGSILDSLENNYNMKNQSKYGKYYKIKNKKIPRYQLLESLILPPSKGKKESELIIELNELSNKNNEICFYSKILMPKNDPFGLIIYNVVNKSVNIENFPFKTIKLYDFNKYNEGSAYCNSPKDLYISGGENNKEFWIINNNNFFVKKRIMPYVKSNHSMLYVKLKNREFIFIAGGEDTKSFIFDLKKNYFTIWSDMNDSHIKPALFKIREYLYIFDNFDYNKNYFERTNLISPEKIWEKIYPEFQTQEASFFSNINFGVVGDENNNIIFIGGDNVKENTYIYDPINNILFLSDVGKDNILLLNDKTFYKINKNESLALPSDFEYNKEIAYVNSNKKSLEKIKINFNNHKREQTISIDNSSFNNDFYQKIFEQQTHSHVYSSNELELNNKNTLRSFIQKQDHTPIKNKNIISKKKNTYSYSACNPQTRKINKKIITNYLESPFFNYENNNKSNLTENQNNNYKLCKKCKNYYSKKNNKENESSHQYIITDPNLDYIKTETNIDYLKSEPNIDYLKSEPNIDYIITDPNINFVKSEPNIDYIKTDPNIEYKNKNNYSSLKTRNYHSIYSPRTQFDCQSMKNYNFSVSNNYNFTSRDQNSEKQKYISNTYYQIRRKKLQIIDLPDEYGYVFSKYNKIKNGNEKTIDNQILRNQKIINNKDNSYQIIPIEEITDDIGEYNYYVSTNKPIPTLENKNEKNEENYEKKEEKIEVKEENEVKENKDENEINEANGEKIEQNEENNNNNEKEENKENKENNENEENSDNNKDEQKDEDNQNEQNEENNENNEKVENNENEENNENAENNENEENNENNSQNAQPENKEEKINENIESIENVEPENNNDIENPENEEQDTEKNNNIEEENNNSNPEIKIEEHAEEMHEENANSQNEIKEETNSELNQQNLEENSNLNEEKIQNISVEKINENPEEENCSVEHIENNEKNEEKNQNNDKNEEQNQNNEENKEQNIDEEEQYEDEMIEKVGELENVKEKYINRNKQVEKKNENWNVSEGGEEDLDDLGYNNEDDDDNFDGDEENKNNEEENLDKGNNL